MGRTWTGFGQDLENKEENYLPSDIITNSDKQLVYQKSSQLIIDSDFKRFLANDCKLEDDAELEQIVDQLQKLEDEINGDQGINGITVNSNVANDIKKERDIDMTTEVLAFEKKPKDSIEKRLNSDNSYFEGIAHSHETNLEKNKNNELEQTSVISVFASCQPQDKKAVESKSIVPLKSSTSNAAILTGSYS